jgi:type IV secretion system protein TrbL
MGTLNKSRGLIVLALILLLASGDIAHAAGVTGVVDSLLAKYKNAGQGWSGALKNAATSIFWILATISLSWTCISMAIKRAEMGEFFAELCRFFMFTGLFFWLLTNGPEFANDVITSLWKIGSEASGTGNSIYPGTLIDLAMQVFQNTIKHVNFLQPESIVVPIIIALIILIVCALTAVNMILLLCAAWVVVYAGLIFLGFGGCRWTSDMAVNYYRTVLGVGASLMTMQLIIGLGISFLQDLFTASGQTPDAPTLALLMVACIILAVIAHRLPQMVAGMVVGGGHNGAIGGVGIMTLIGTAIAGSSLAGSAAAAGASTAAAESHKLLLDRIAAAEAAIAAGSGIGNIGSANTTARQDPNAANTGVGVTGSNRNPTGTDAGASIRPTTASNISRAAVSPGLEKTSTGPASAVSPRAEEPDEAPLTRPMTPDEQRGFPPPTDPPEWKK